MIRHLARALALGAIFAALSELAFYPVDLTPSFAITAFAYAIAWLAALTLMASRGAGGLAAGFLAMALVGFVAEGVVVAQLYEVLGFSILWTPVAWHALISGGLGVIGWRRAAARGWGTGAAYALALGALLGIWGAWAWPALGEGGGGAYAPQMIGAALLLAAGHAVLGAVPPGGPSRWLTWPVWTFVLLIWAISWAVPFFPVSLTFPALALLTAWALRAPGPDPFARPVPPARHALAALIPAAAIPVQAAVPPDWEVNAVWAAVTCILGGALWLAALWRARRG